MPSNAIRAMSLLASAVLASSSTAVAQSRGIEGHTAPAWHIDTWFNLPDGVTTLDIADCAGKVVYLYCFQSWCPGCHSHGFPTLQALIKHYEGNDDVAFVAVQTTFEGWSSNTPARARHTGDRYDLKIPVGHSGAKDAPSKLMRAYRTGGTPWTIIIDRDGTVRFDDFRISQEKAVALIDRLLAQQPRPRSPSVAIKTLPEGRGGQDLVNTRWADPDVDRWARRTHTSKVLPRATLYRWWTDGCQWCEVSLPAIEALRRKYGDAHFRTVAIYHPKPPGRTSDETIVAAANGYGYNGDLAVDPDWSALRTAWLDSGTRSATSVTILVDSAGIVRFVHPGPVFGPSDVPKHAQRASDYAALDAAIGALLHPTVASDEDVKPDASPGTPPS